MESGVGAGFRRGATANGNCGKNIGVLPKEITCLISSPMQSAQFRETFNARAQVVKGVFASDGARELLAEMKEEVAEPMKRHLTRCAETIILMRSGGRIRRAWTKCLPCVRT